MCGISGFLDLNHATPAPELRRITMRMTDTLRHRGPNDAGVWADEGAGIALGMRRLAILDLSPAGHQPMESASGRYMLVFNGEIYNYQDLRNELSHAYSFRGSSDTEVMLAAFEQWGIESSVSRFNGMFAFALWDRQGRNLTLGRDRFGEKPLYYARMGSHFIFGSELKALRAHPQFAGEVDVDAAALFLRYSCVPAPYSIYKHTSKLPAATLLKVSADDFASTPQPYWSLRSVVDEAVSHPFYGSEHEAVEQLDSILRDAVRIRMHSDVPLGAFLSGGIDSSIIVSLMQAQSRTRVKTFTIGSHDKEFDEARDAAKVAAHLGTEHTELYVTAEKAMSVIPMLPRFYDEPFADSSQIPTLLVSQLAKEHVTVSLSGDGGDELFGGYTRHIWGDTLDRLHRVPLFLRRFGAAGIRTIPPEGWDSLSQMSWPVAPARWRQRIPGHKLHKLASLLESRSVHSLYEKLSSHWLDTEKILPGASFISFSEDNPPSLRHSAENLMYLDAIGYLPDDILVKLDRATMAVSLEGRVPFLDHRVAEFAWRLPLSMKIRQRQGKWILRQVLYRYVPREMVDRPKSGFGIPLAAWLRGPLRDWAESLLDERRLRQEGFFNPAPILKMWQEHLSGKQNWEYHLWDVLMFQGWLEESRRTPDGLSSDSEDIANATMESA
ncbi:asparagine synthase (glutamine-hydrolyzing) [Granulicella mallensis]|uniref:asparagine synthase (glutamine-hydrolyzing) n=1 Tax=Granulicella mallensis TaxID=940614 RepID=A0A7W8ED85_9BACT|nr:asparagine synthase (glutamine-hydrolyzing) [Granulicella mallensis]MBB5066455.1 asparagine synthase (glutamine-hydrolyzing) [Granulicella mallensis]